VSSTAAFYAFGRCRFYRTGYFHCPTVKVDLPQRVRLQLETVIHWASQVLLAAEIAIFRAVARTGKVWGEGISQNVVWYVVKTCCERVGLEHIAPHDLRRTCAKLCHDSGGELEQIQFLLGHVSVQTTERLPSITPAALVH
jgi:integrase